MKTVTPCVPSRRATSYPMPLLAPVTSAIFAVWLAAILDLQWGGVCNGPHSTDVYAMDQHEGTPPARLGEEMFQQVDQVVEAYGGVGQGLGGGVVGPVDDQGFADDIFARDESPVAAIEGGIAVIAHGKIAARRHDDFAVRDVMLQHVLSLIEKVHVEFAGEIVAVRLYIFGLMVDVGLFEFLAVQVDLLVYELDVVARNTHAALHESLANIDRITEHDDVAALDVFVRQKVLGDRAGRGVGQLVHQEVIADEQRILHGACGNHESLDQRGGAEEEQDDGDCPFGDETARLFGPGWGRGGSVLHFRHGDCFLLFHSHLL